MSYFLLGSRAFHHMACNYQTILHSSSALFRVIDDRLDNEDFRALLMKYGTGASIHSGEVHNSGIIEHSKSTSSYDWI